MDKMKNRFSKLGKINRTYSNSSVTSSSAVKNRSQSYSEMLDSEHTTPTFPHSLIYHGYMCVEDPRSSKEVLGALRAIRDGALTNNKPVNISLYNGTLRVSEGSGAGILECLIQSMAMAVHDVTKGGYSDCLAISFSIGHYAKQCHTFQAKSSREAADIVQMLQKAFRTANKDGKKFRKTDSGASMTKPTSSEVAMVRRPLQFMEDEDEVIEHKSIVHHGLRRDSKRAIPAIVRTSGEVSSSNTSLTGSNLPADHSSSSSSSALPPQHKAKRKLGVTQGEFTQQNKVEHLQAAIKKIQEDNADLQDKARRILTPSNIFEDSLSAMRNGDSSLLSSYMNLGSLANAHDNRGNTLLHYAVALGQLQSVKILCANNASLEAAGWNDCKPIHRAVAEGNTAILQTLLRHGADVNSLDLMRRTPLHFSSAQMELMECSISLLEFGAHIMSSDVLGLRPFDLNPELKETLNRLVTSACETFVSAPLKDGGKDPSPQGGTPNSISPSSSRPNSSLGMGGSQDSWDSPLGGDDDLAQIVDMVTLRAKVIASRAHARKKFRKSMTQGHSRSHGNLMELLEEAEEDELIRKERLRYPSDFSIDSTYYEILHNKEKTLRGLRELIRAGKAVEKGHGTREGEEDVKNDLELSLSEPDLHREEFAESDFPRPFSSAAIMQSHRVKALLGDGVKKFRMDSGSSSGTLREDEEMDDVSIQRLSKAFDILQEEIKRDSFQKSDDDELEVAESAVLSDHLAQQLRLPHHLSADSSPLMEQRSKEETVAIFNEILAQIGSASPQNGIASRDELSSHSRDQSPLPQSKKEASSQDDKIGNGTKIKGDSGKRKESESARDKKNRIRLSLTKRRVKSSDLPKRRDLIRPSSSASLNKGEEQKDGTSLRAGSMEAELVFGTLPLKKKRSKLAVIKRIGSPLFKSRRKSFTAGNPPSNPTPSIAHTSSNATPPVIQEEGVRRKLSLPENNTPSHGQGKAKMSPSSLEDLVDDRTGAIKEDSTRRGSGGVARRGTLGMRRGSKPKDECLNALIVMTTLSSNKECLNSLISHICLPKCVSKMLEIAQSPITTPKVLRLISTLIYNIYQSGGAEGKKTALGSGVLDLTIKLLQTRDPIPETCLSLLNNLLVSDDDNDYLRTIIRIPTAPLLQYLEGYDPGESDSGYENSNTNHQVRRDTNISMETRYSSDAMSTATDEGVGMGSSNYLGLPRRPSGPRSSSFNSETSESSSAQSVFSPPIHAHRTPDLDPRRIVLKMLAVSSSHSKMQLSLSSERAVSLLANCISDPSQENLTNTLITLANIAQNTMSHSLFRQLNLVKKLQSLLFHGPRPRYHATRTLVYLGHLDFLSGCSLFDPVAMGYETDTVIQSTNSDGHTYARGATIEKCVELLTSDCSSLWGGFSLMVGPQPQDSESLPTLHASKDQILQFFLTTYKSFVHPLIFMRLLLHRLSYNDSLNLFDWSNKADSTPTTTHLVSVPPTQINILNLIGQWLEMFPDDFTNYPSLKEELEKVIGRLKLARGPYIPHTHRLRSLLQDTDRPRTEKVDLLEKNENRPPHHDNLYRLCQQMVTGGHLPVTVHQAIFMASLQLHIEDISGGPVGGSPSTPSHSRRRTSRFKSAFPPGFSKSKNIIKRVKTQVAEFEKLSERNAKHLYIERCQANPGYDCSFFNVKVPSSGRFKRAPVAKQLMGINNKRIVFLDEKTKDLITSHSLQSVLNVTRESDPCILVINLRGDAAGFKIQVDSAGVAKEVANIIEDLREGEGMLDETPLRWSDSVPSLFTMSVEPGMVDTDSSISTAEHTPTERETTPPGQLLSYDMLKNSSPAEGMMATPPNGHVEMLLSHKSDTLKAFSRDDSLVTDLADHMTILGSEKLLFCDCPPDPEIPPEINLKSLTLEDILSCPLEVARQMSIIAQQRFCELTATELLQKVHLIPKTSSQQQRDSITSTSTLRASMVDAEMETAVEKLAFRFNQVGNWVADSILQFEFLDERVAAIQRFISIAKYCYELGNFSSMMAIVVAGLGSAPIRRLQLTWRDVPKADMELFKEMDSMLDSKGNYKHYRDRLAATEVPAVPYVGVFLKDLTFICDGNPDYLRGGLINIHKRRQVYKLLEEIHHYQKDRYKLHTVIEFQSHLLGHKLITEDDLHATSHLVEPRNSIRRSHSSSSTKNLSSVQGRSIFRGLTRSASSSSSVLNRTSLT